MSARATDFILRCRRRPAPVRHLAAAVVALGCALLRVAIGDAVTGLAFATLLPAIIVASAIGGFWPGVTAMAVGGALVWIFLIPHVTIYPIAAEWAAGLGYLLLGTLLNLLTDNIVHSLESALRQAKEKSDLLAEIHHRLKNQLQFVALMLGNQARIAASKDTASALDEAAERIVSIASVHERLYLLETDAADLAKHIEGLCRDVLATTSGVSLDIEIDSQANLRPEHFLPFSLIVSELVTNACKHAFKGGIGTVVVRLRKDADGLRLTVDDDGIPLPNGLMKLGVRNGLGLRLIESLTRQIGGRLIVGDGAKFTIVLPRS